MKKYLVGALAIFLITVGLNFSHTAEGDLDLAGQVDLMAKKGGHKDIGSMD
ncbi:hypothetical protein ACLIA0_04705 [Bacillaceae bacterium W0354]